MKRMLVPLFFLFVVAFIGCSKIGTAPSPVGESVRDRVIKSETIRAAWLPYPPLCMRNSAGKRAGIGVEILDEIGRRLSLKVEWVEAGGWGTLFDELQADRYDIFGVGVWQNASRGRLAIFSDPFLFNPLKVWGRPGDTRFTRLQDLNDPKVVISKQDGAMEALIAASDFPKSASKAGEVPESSPWTNVLMNIVSSKADVTFADPSAVSAFLESNPSSLVELFPSQPVRVFPTCFAMKMGAFEFKAMIDSALVEMNSDGTIDRILRKYEKRPGDFYRVAIPYQLPR
jgi:ABC-type amino acid transport substrate-binding protein